MAAGRLLLAAVSHDNLDDARYAAMRWNTPLSEAHARLLLDRLEIGHRDSVLDLGCGWGELLLRAVGGHGATGVGVDTDGGLLQRGRAAAADRGLGDRVTFVEGRAQEWREPADRIVCIGSAHAWGGARRALSGLARLVAPGGRVLFGDGVWETPPTEAARELFGDDVLPLPELQRLVAAAGWRVVHRSVAGLNEWDEFEDSWRAGREEWRLAHAGDPRAAAVATELAERLSEYVDVYRGVLGFSYLVLTR
jgi:cyclopropane fatty-acyl-phospholipid synthase-like methyltransferase